MCILTLQHVTICVRCAAERNTTSVWRVLTVVTSYREASVSVTVMAATTFAVRSAKVNILPHIVITVPPSNF